MANTMTHTLADARVSGMVAAMDSNFSGEIPGQFDGNPSLRSEWIDAYNSMAVTMDQRCYSPDMFAKPEPKPQRKPRQKAAKPVAAASSTPKIEAKKSMMAILEGSFVE